MSKSASWDGSASRRTVAHLIAMWNSAAQPPSYLLEVVATNERGFLGVAAVNENVGPSTLTLEQSCEMGALDARSPQVFARRRVWAQMALGVQFSSFPA